MDFARRDMLVERRFEVIGVGPRLGKRQDPEPTTTESTPAQTPTSSAPPEITSIPPTSTTPTTLTTPIETTTSPTSVTSSDPVSTPVSTPTSTTPVSTPVTSGPSTPIETSQQSTPTSISPTSPTDPAQTSSAASQPSPSATSEISTSAAGTTNAPVVTTRVITSVLTNGAGSTVTVLSTSTSVGPTASPSNSGSSNNTGAIVGGVVGGVGGLLLLIALLWFIRRKTHKDKFEENMFAPDRNVDRREMDLAGDDVDDPEAIARPYHLPPSPTRNEMAMSTGSQPLSAQSHGQPLSELDETTSGMSRPTSGTSYYTQPGSAMGMPMPMTMTMPIPMPMSRDHIAYTHSRANSTHDHLTQPSEPATSEGGSSSARLMKDREARRLHVANDNEVIVHTDGGRVDEEPEEDAPREIPPTYESIGGPSGAR